MITIRVKYILPICHIRNDKYKWMQLDTIYDTIVNVPLFHIIHIGNGDICGTQHEIATKRLSTISTIRVYEFSSRLQHMKLRGKKQCTGTEWFQW